MAYILDPDINTVESNVVPLGSTPSTITSCLDTQVVESLILGNGGTSYTFPKTKAPTANYVLSDPGTGILEWVENGDNDHPILNGGQPGSIIIGSTDSVFQLTTGAGLTPQIELNQDGTLKLGDPLTENNIILSGGLDFHFKQITGTDTNYTLTNNDYAIEVISDTYTNVTLPTAIGNAGRTYMISRGSDTQFNLTAQSGETIDGDPFCKYKRKNTRMTVMSNGIGEWYIV